MTLEAGRDVRIVVVGAGIAGLSAAHALLRRLPAAEVIVLEQQARVGGLIETERTRDGFLVEQGPDSLVTWKASGLRAVHEGGLDHALVTGNGVRRHAFVVRGGELLPLPDALLSGVPTAVGPLLASPLLSLRAKARLALEPLCARMDGGEDADESVAEFVRRRFGDEVLERVVAPLVAGIYGAEAEQLGMRSTMPQLRAMERDYGSIAWAMFRTRKQRAASTGRAAVVSLSQGMEMLPRALAAHLGARVRTGVTVDAIACGADRRFALRGPGLALSADAVVVATPAHVAARLLGELEPELAQALSSIPHGAQCSVSTAFEQSQLPQLRHGTGFIVPSTERRATSACSFMSLKWPGRAPEGRVLLRSFVKLPAEANDHEIAEAALHDLRELLGVTGPPLWQRVRRRALGLPRYGVGHAQLVQRIDQLAAALGPLALAGNALRGVGIPDCIDSGVLAAERIAG